MNLRSCFCEINCLNWDFSSGGFCIFLLERFSEVILLGWERGWEVLVDLYGNCMYEVSIFFDLGYIFYRRWF